MGTVCGTLRVGDIVRPLRQCQKTTSFHDIHSEGSLFNRFSKELHKNITSMGVQNSEEIKIFRVKNDLITKTAKNIYFAGSQAATSS